MADVNANIGVHIDTSASIAQLKALRSEISRFHQSVNKSSAAAALAQRDLQTNLVNSINATGKFHAKMGLIRTSTEAFTHALETNKLSMREYFRYAGGASTTFRKLFAKEFDTITNVARDRVKQLQTQYIKLGRDASGAMQAISVRPVSLDMKNYGTQVAIAAQRQALLNQLLKQGSTNLLNFGKNTQWAGRQLMVGFTVPLAYLGTAAAKTFMTLEEQALKFRRVYGEMFTTTEQTDKALQSVRDLAKEFTKYGVAVEKTMELAASAAAMGKMGADLTAQVAEATRLAVLGGVEQQQALETTISITNAFGVSADELAKKIDFLNAVENQTVVSIEDLTIAIPKAGPVVQQLGGDVEDLAFFLTAMKEGGINASEGANALKSGLASLINPTDKASKMLAQMGINIKGIVEANKGDVRNTVIDFAKALDTLDPLNRARAIEQLFGKFQFSRLSTLFQNVTKDGTQAARVMDLMGASVEELAILSERELKKVEDAIGVNFKEAVQQLKLTLEPIGKVFLQTVTPIVKFIGRLLEKFNGLEEGTKKFIVIATVLVGIIGPTFLMAFGLVANALANIIKLFATMRAGALKLRGGSAVLAEQTNYLTKEQMEAAQVAAALDQAHNRLTQRFTSEAQALEALRQAFDRAAAAQARFAASNPGMMLPGFKGNPKYVPGSSGFKTGKGFATGTTEVVGGTSGKDSVPALLMPGEAVVPTDIAQDEKFKPLIAALVSGDIAKYGTGSTGVSFEDREYNARTAKSAQSVRKFLDGLSKNPDGTYTYIDPKDPSLTKTFTKERLGFILNKYSGRGDLNLDKIQRGLNLGKSYASRGGGGSSAPPWIKDLKNKAKYPNILAEKEAVTTALEKQGIKLSQEKLNNLFQTQASHVVPDVDKNGKKIWRAANIVPDSGWVNNYLNRIKGNIGKELLSLSDNDLKKLGIDRQELKNLMNDRHPTTGKAAGTLANIARFDIERNPTAKNIYQAHAVVAGMNYRSQAGYYPKSGAIKTLAQLFPKNKNVIAEIAMGKGEGLLEKGKKKLQTVTGQTGKPLRPGQKVSGGAPGDKRVMPVGKVARVIPKGIKGPGFVTFGADDGFPKVPPLPPGFGIKSGQSAPMSNIERDSRRSQAAIKDLTEKLDKNAKATSANVSETEKATKAAQKTKFAEKWDKAANAIFNRKATAPSASFTPGIKGGGSGTTSTPVANAQITDADKRSMAMQRVGAVSGGIAMAAGTASMGAFMTGNAGAGMALMGISAIASIAPMLMNPVGAIVAALIAGVAVVYKFNKDIEKARQAGIDLAKAMTLSSEDVKELGLITGKVSATEIADRRRQNVLSGGITEPQRQFGQNVLQSEFGKKLLSNVETLSKSGMEPKDVAKNISTQLGQAILQGVITTDQAAGIASALGEQLGSYEIPLNITGNLNKIFGPNGENLATDPLRVTLEIKKQSMEDQANAFNLALQNRKPLKTAGGAAQIGLGAGLMAAGGAITATGLGAPVGIGVAAVGAVITLAELKEQNDAKAANLKLDTAAIQLGVEAVAQGQDLIDSLNKQYDAKIAQATTTAEINRLEQERQSAVAKINSENKKTLQTLIDQKDQLSPGAFDAAIKASVDSMYKEGPMSVFKDQALTALNELQDSEFKAKMQLGFASGDVDPLTLINILKMASSDGSIQKNIDLLISEQGFANMSLMTQLLDAAAGGDQATFDVLLNYVNTNEKSFDEDLEAVRRIADFKGAYDITLDMKTNGAKKIQVASLALTQIEGLPDLLTKEALIQANTDGRFNDIVANWDALSEGKDSINKNLIVNYKVGSTDQNVINAAKAANMTVPEYLAKGFMAPATTTPTTPTKTGAKSTKQRDTTLDDLLNKLKFIRDASINAQGGIKELMNITSKKGITKFGGAMQQLMAGPKGGFNREFISFLESMDNKTRKTYMTIKDGKVVLTEQGKALKEAFNEKAIGEYQVAQRQTIQDTKAQGAALKKLASAGVDSFTALEMVADANLAVAINSKDITGKELRNMADAAKEAKAEIEALNLEVKNLAKDLSNQLDQSDKTIKALQIARQAGIVDPKQLEFISTNMSVVTEILNKGIASPLAAGNIEFARMLELGREQQAALINPAEAAMQAFVKLKDAAFKVFDRQDMAAQQEYNNSMSALVSKILPKLNNKEYAKLTIEEGLDKVNDQIENINKAIDNISNFDIRPLTLSMVPFEDAIAALQEESSDLSNDLTLMDKVVDGINEKYDRQADALQKVADANQEILSQQKSQLDLAEAITSGSISAAARAAQEARAQAAANAQKIAMDNLETARKAELANVKSSRLGMTREQIQNRQFDIGQETFRLEEQMEPIKARILGYERQIESKRTEILQLQKDILFPLQAEAAFRQSILDKKTEAIRKEKESWDVQQVALDAATTSAGTFATNARSAATAFKDAYDYYLKITGLKSGTFTEAASLTAKTETGGISTGTTAGATTTTSKETTTAKTEDLLPNNPESAVYKTRLQNIESAMKLQPGKAWVFDQRAAEDGEGIKAWSKPPVPKQSFAGQTFYWNDNLGWLSDEMPTSVVKDSHQAAGAAPYTAPSISRDYPDIGFSSMASSAYEAAQKDIAKNTQVYEILTGKTNSMLDDIVSALSEAAKGTVGGYIAGANIANQNKDISIGIETRINGNDISDHIIYSSYDERQKSSNSSISSGSSGGGGGGGMMLMMARGGMVKPKYFANGAFARGTDTIPAMLTPGEFVVSRYAVQDFGLNNLNKINDGSYDGGSVYNYNLSVNVKSDANPNEIARTVMTQIKQIDSQRIRTQM